MPCCAWAPKRHAGNRLFAASFCELRNRSAAVTRIGFLDIGGRRARRGLQQFLQEGGLAAARRRLLAFKRDHMSVFQPVMTQARDLVALVEINREDLALQYGGGEKGDL